MKDRESKPDDKEKGDYACELLLKLMKTNSEIGVGIWIGALFSVLIKLFLHNKVPFECFSERLELLKQYYKDWLKE
jgi:hypothetical protein